MNSESENIARSLDFSIGGAAQEVYLKLNETPNCYTCPFYTNGKQPLSNLIESYFRKMVGKPFLEATHYELKSDGTLTKINGFGRNVGLFVEDKTGRSNIYECGGARDFYAIVYSILYKDRNSWGEVLRHSKCKPTIEYDEHWDILGTEFNKQSSKDR